jgi:membrane protein YqaA with SNARE-associated domain
MLRLPQALAFDGKGRFALLAADLSAYGGLFISALLAATILPVSSELVLAGLLATRTGEVPLLLAVATIGNTLGSVINWLIGRGIEKFRDRKWFPVSAEHYARAEAQFKRFGLWSLLFAWLPVVGDPLTIVAGALRTPIVPFVILVGIGKAARYAAIAAGFAAWGGV